LAAFLFFSGFSELDPLKGSVVSELAGCGMQCSHPGSWRRSAPSAASAVPVGPASSLPTALPIPIRPRIRGCSIGDHPHPAWGRGRLRPPPFPTFKHSPVWPCAWRFGARHQLHLLRIWPAELSNPGIPVAQLLARLKAEGLFSFAAEYMHMGVWVARPHKASFASPAFCKYQIDEAQVG
jgi:hypothetical protein